MGLLRLGPRGCRNCLSFLHLGRIGGVWCYSGFGVFVFSLGFER